MQRRCDPFKVKQDRHPGLEPGPICWRRARVGPARRWVPAQGRDDGPCFDLGKPHYTCSFAAADSRPGHPLRPAGTSPLHGGGQMRPPPPPPGEVPEGRRGSWARHEAGWLTSPGHPRATGVNRAQPSSTIEKHAPRAGERFALTLGRACAHLRRAQRQMTSNDPSSNSAPVAPGAARSRPVTHGKRHRRDRVHAGRRRCVLLVNIGARILGHVR